MFFQISFAMFLIVASSTAPDNALEGFLGIKGYWTNTYRDMGYFCEKT